MRTESNIIWIPTVSGNIYHSVGILSITVKGNLLWKNFQKLIMRDNKSKYFGSLFSTIVSRKLIKLMKVWVL